MEIRIDVLVMLAETSHHIKAWVVKADNSGELYGMPNDDDRPMPETNWSELALEINSRARSGNHERLDVFLYLRNGLLSCINYHGILKKIVAAVQHHVWASNVYVVWDRPRGAEPIVEQLCTPDKSNVLVHFYRILLQERVTGLIEIPFVKPPRKLTTEAMRTFLHRQAKLSLRRRADLKQLVSEDGWSFRLRNEARSLSHLLRPFKERHLPSSASNDLLIFESGTKEAVEALIGNSTARRKVIAATDESYSDDLKEAADSAKPPVKLLEFQNIFEVIYALLQLNDAAMSEPRLENLHLSASEEQEKINADVPIEIEPVKVIASARFIWPTTTPPQGLLVTSAFDDEAEPYHSKAAAKEIGAIRRSVNSLQDVEVYPYMSCQSFPKLLESGTYAAWIHLSHGSEEGLYDPQKKMIVSPEHWLNCFISYKGSLSLAIFSSCHSAHVAELFAAAGVGVAIGFKDKVLPAATEILAQTIVPAAMRGGNPEAILEAFRVACRRLAARITADGENYGEAQPIAYYSPRNLL
jgi:hypothetical protein